LKNYCFPFPKHRLHKRLESVGVALLWNRRKLASWGSLKRILII